MYLALVGSREFDDYDFFKKEVDSFIKKKRIKKELVIVSGGARGADRLAERYANEQGYSLIVLHADWENDGKLAGFKRNVDIVGMSDYILAFWDTFSAGTKHTIDTAKEFNKNITVVEVPYVPKNICF